MKPIHFKSPLLVALLVVMVPTAHSQPTEPATGAAAAAVPEDQRHRVGRYEIELPGLPADVYFDTVRRYGRVPTEAELLERNNGDGYMRDPANAGNASWQVHCPDGYTPEQAYGVLVFINAGERGDVHPVVAELLAERRLIAIGAHRAGNPHPAVFRHAAAVHALQLVRERYHVDEDRVYVHGISGGGRMTSHVALMNAEDFDGAICIVGANPYKHIPADQGPNTVYRGFWRVPDRRLLQLAREENRLVLFTGEHDGNRRGTLQVYKAYLRDGFARLLYLEEPGLGHAFASKAYFEQALDFLDAPVYADAQPAYRRAQAAEGAGRVGDALRDYTSAANHHRAAAWGPDARAKADALRARYDAESAAIEAMFNSDASRNELNTAINAFAQTWGPTHRPTVIAWRLRLRDR